MTLWAVRRWDSLLKPHQAEKWNGKSSYRWDGVSKFTSCSSARPGVKVKDVSTLLKYNRLPGRPLKGRKFELKWQKPERFVFCFSLGGEEKKQPPTIIRQKLRKVLMLVIMENHNMTWCVCAHAGSVHDQTSAWGWGRRKPGWEQWQCCRPGGWLSLL